jgi:hypothetical protein
MAARHRKCKLSAENARKMRVCDLHHSLVAQLRLETAVGGEGVNEHNESRWQSRSKTTQIAMGAGQKGVGTVARHGRESEKRRHVTRSNRASGLDPCEWRQGAARKVRYTDLKSIACLR